MPLPKGIHLDPEVRRVWIMDRQSVLDQYDALLDAGTPPTKAAHSLGQNCAGLRAMRASVDSMANLEDYQTGHAKGMRIDLGLALLSLANPGDDLDRPREQLTCREIAAWCGCTHAAIQSIERRAIRQLHRRLNALLREQVITADFGGDRLPALLADAA